MVYGVAGQVVRGSHLMPAEWGSVSHIYDLEQTGFQGFGGSSKGRTVAEGYAPSGAIQNHVKFGGKGAEAGSAIL